MSLAEASAADPFKSISSVTTDTACRKCGYNLRGLTTSARCPECGIAVAASTSGDLLRYCDPTWVNALARGVKLMIAGIVVIILGVIAAIILGLAVKLAATYVAAALAGVVGNVLMVIGSWLLTVPDPSGVGEDQYGTARKIIRITLAIGVGNSLLEIFLKSAAVPPDVSQVLGVASGLAGVSAVVGLIAELQYLEKLANRVSAPPLSARAGFLKKVFPASYLALIVLGLGLRLLGRGQPGSAFAFMGCFSGIIGIAVLIFGLMYLSMLEKFRGAFKEQAELAAHNWAAHAP